MKQIFFASMIIGSIFAAQTTIAQTHTPVVNHRQVRQQHRIEQGVRSGELTHHETRNLEHRERKIQHDKKMAKSDGYVSRAERRHLRREENRTSHAIYRDKHNKRVRG